jgi:hypothetical protein
MHSKLGFTGRDGDAYYYKGLRWFGPTNLIGYKKLKPWRLVVVEVGMGLYPDGRM